MFQLGCNLPNLAILCLHISTTYKFNPFCEGDKALHEKIRECMTDGPSIMSTRNVIVEKTSIRNSSRIVNRLLELIQAIYNQTQWVTVCQHDYT